jgi:hypothetical protein
VVERVLLGHSEFELVVSVVILMFARALLELSKFVQRVRMLNTRGYREVLIHHGSKVGERIRRTDKLTPVAR